MTLALPGMNPYLENPDIWTEVHTWLIVQLARDLNPLIKPKYRVVVEQLIYTDSLLVGIPDVSVFQNQPSKGQAVATSTLSKPIKVNVPMPVEVKETYLEIRQIGTGKVATVIEVLSPKNKRPGEGRNQYSANGYDEEPTINPNQVLQDIYEEASLDLVID